MKIFGNRWVLLTVLALTWGTSFILIKKSLIAFTPYQVGAVRITLAGLVLLALAGTALSLAFLANAQQRLVALA